MSHDRESVHFSIAVQPHGLLLGLSDPALTVMQVSANTWELLGMAPQALLGQPLETLLDSSLVEALRQELQQLDVIYPLHLSLQTAAGSCAVAGSVRRLSAGVLLELEPVQAAAALGLVTMAARQHSTIAKLQQSVSLREFFQLVATEVRQITQFDRVMVYQFDPQGAGEVIAEAKRDGFASYLGLHYPATDIPEAVRQLYATGMMRFIPDLGAPEVPLLSVEPTATIDLSAAILRGVDPCCVTYHQNMGVAALLVIAVLNGNQLWGLISCHHATPKLLTVEVRQTCKVIGQFVSSQLASKVNDEELDYLVKLRSLRSEFVQSIAQIDDLKQALVNPAPRLLDLVNATGAAICLEGEVTLLGTTPTVEQVHDLLQWAETQPWQNSLLHTAALPKQCPAAIAYCAIASGLLLLQISQVRRYYILWFRPEVLQTVNWAGNPNDAIAVAADGSSLSPRQSFAQWQETVRCTALPWKPCELENAFDLRSAIVGIVLRKADELAQINQELEHRNRELDSFAYAASHDLKEPLRGIHNFSTLLLKGYADQLDAAGIARLQTLVRLTRRMESLIDALLKFSRLGQTELHLQATDLQPLIQEAIADLRVSHPELTPMVYLPESLPIVFCDPILITDVFTTLLSNAFKYNDEPTPQIEIGWLLPKSPTLPSARSGLPALDPAAALTFYIRDNGIGIRERHLQLVFRLFKRLHEQNLYGGGTGAGLTIARKIIERHRGQIWVESTYGKGTTVYFTLNPA